MKKRLKNKGIRIGTLIGGALLIAVLLVMLLPGGVVITPIGIPSVDSGVVLASPDTERQSPDVLIVQDNLTGSVTDIQDDPDSSPDANWLTAPNNVATTVRVSFPTPTGNPTTGAGLQEFRILLRKTATNNGKTDDTYTIHLYENGVQVQANIASGGNVPTGGVVISATWDASNLTTADGSLVECYVTTTPEASSSPTTRGSIEVGAVEWNVDYYIPPNISNTPDNYPFGIVSEGSTSATGLTNFTVTNSTSFAVNITLSGTDMTGPGVTWELSEDASTGENIYGLKAGLEGGDYTIVVPEETANTLVSGLAGGGGTQKWGLQFLAPTTFTDGGAKSGTVTLTATQA